MNIYVCIRVQGGPVRERREEDGEEELGGSEHNVFIY